MSAANEKYREALRGASKNAARAFDSISDTKYAHVPDEDKSAWAMAALIHCDICRLVVAMEECEPDGIARLLCISDVSSKLYESRNWFNNAGSKLLLQIAKRKVTGVKEVTEETEKLRKTHQIHRINKYAEYRNKFGYHYDVQALAQLRLFGAESADEFFDVLRSFIQFTGAWAELTKTLVRANDA